jgi:predicted PurR-regulated permease PerM
VVTVVGLLILQQIVVNIIGPKVVGDALGLHPMVVLLALLVGIRVAGVWGAVFAIPLAGVIYAMGYSLYRRQRASASVQSL